MNEQTKMALEGLKVKYINALPEKVILIRHHIQQKVLTPVQQEFHKLKGSGKTYGFSEITDIAFLIDRHCKANHPQSFEFAEKACILLDKIKDAFDKQLPFDVKADPLFKEIQ